MQNIMNIVLDTNSLINVLKSIPFPKVEVIGIDDFKCFLASWLTM